MSLFLFTNAMFYYFCSRFKELLRRRLTECGWREEIRVLCRDTIKERGVNNVTVDEIVEEVTPKGRGKNVYYFYFLKNTRLKLSITFTCFPLYHPNVSSLFQLLFQIQ